MKIKKRYLIVIIAVILFITLLLLVLNKGILNIDQFFIDFILNIRNKNLTSFFKVITRLANPTFLIIITAVLLLFIKKKDKAILIPINLGIIALLNALFKVLIQRSRPIYKLIKQNGYSFPSGHSSISVAFYGFLAYLIYKNVKNKKLKISLISILFILILLIGFSRIYLGVHYFTDVIAGFLLGITYLIIFIEIIKKRGM